MEIEINKAPGIFLKYILAPSQQSVFCVPHYVFQLLLRAVWWQSLVLKKENP